MTNTTHRPSPLAAQASVRWPRLILGGLVLAGSGVAVMALAGSRSPEVAPTKALSPLESAAMKAGRSDARQLEEQTAELVARCERPLANGAPDAAISACADFLAHPTLGARAHAATSAAHMMTEPNEIRKSALHAEAATKLGSPAGKYLWAYHGLNGESGVQMEPEVARKALQEAQAGGMAKADRLLAVLDKMDSCQAAAQFRLLDQPAFCLLRPQLDRWLKASGMTARPSRQAWRDEYNPAAVLPDASSFEVTYDRDPGAGMFYVASMDYRFLARNASADGELLARLARLFVSKYGSPASGVLPPPLGGSTSWRISDGIQIDLMRDASGDLRVRYQLPGRVKAALAHAEELRARRDERRAELTQRAL